MVDTAGLTRFTDDPVASDSGRFPLGRPSRMPDDVALASRVGVRPWGLRAMRSLPRSGAENLLWCYDHERQITVGADGNKLRMATANKVTNSDGDEGPSEDFTYDFTPDSPESPA